MRLKYPTTHFSDFSLVMTVTELPPLTNNTRKRKDRNTFTARHFILNEKQNKENVNHVMSCYIVWGKFWRRHCIQPATNVCVRKLYKFALNNITRYSRNSVNNVVLDTFSLQLGLLQRFKVLQNISNSVLVLICQKV